MKIAIYASGELRSFLDDDKMLPYFVDFLKHHGHEVKVFGHTWTHCDRKNRLKHSYIDEFSIEDQRVIQQWQLEDIMVRKIITDESIENPIPLSSENLKKFIETYTKNYGLIFGQVWSQIRCFELFYPKVNDFDVHIRWRWDNQFGEHGFGTEKSHMMIDRIENLKFEDQPLLITTNHAQLGGVIHSGGMYFSGRLPDDFFCLNKNAMNILLESNVGDILHNILKNRGNLNITPTSHTLWYEYLVWASRNIKYEFGIPSVLTLVR